MVVAEAVEVAPQEHRDIVVTTVTTILEYLKVEVLVM
jgi:hypothetical protein